MGGLAPIIVDGLPYGTVNTYSAGVPPGAPLKGDVDAKYQKYLLQESNAMFTQLLGRGASVGKVAVFMDCSNSATLWFNGKFEVKPARTRTNFWT